VPEQKLSESITFSVDPYLKTSHMARELLLSVKSQLAIYKSSKFDKKESVAGLVLSLIGFFCGVVFPMFYKELDATIYILVPVICYVIIFSYFLYFVAEK
jgi:hypothetical protein